MSSRDIDVQINRDPGALAELSPEWSELADAAGARFYAQPFWALTWWRRRGRGVPHVVTVRSHGSLVALAPLFVERVARVDVARFLGYDLGPVSELLVAPGHPGAAEALWSALLGHGRFVADLRFHRREGEAFAALRRSPEDLWRAELGPACPTIRLSGSWAAYREARPSGLRRKLRRAAAAAEREGVELDLVVVEAPDEVVARLPDVTAIFDAAEAAQPRLHFLAEPYRGFTAAMLEAAAQEKRLALVLLYVRGRPAASAFFFRSGDTLAYSGPRFDPAFAAFSPGHLVLERAVEHAFAVGMAEVDLLIGDTPYKREWSTDVYDTYRLIAASSGRLHRASALVEFGVRSYPRRVPVTLEPLRW
jgi:CelD/BcsL family acetyltransferase involved in cellulose biosynthesis